MYGSCPLSLYWKKTSNGRKEKEYLCIVPFYQQQNRCCTIIIQKPFANKADNLNPYLVLLHEITGEFQVYIEWFEDCCNSLCLSHDLSVIPQCNKSSERNKLQHNIKHKSLNVKV